MKDPLNIGIKGSGTAFVTPFTDDGKVDVESCQRVMNDSLEAGINFMCVLGTTSEVPTLSPAEQKQVRDIAVKVNKGRRPILLGYGGNCTADIIERMRHDSFEGIDALLIITPYYNKPSQEGLYQHFRALAEASPRPIVLYNVPGRTGVNMTAETTLRLARDCHNIIGIKEASGKMDQVQEIIKKRPEGFRVLSGDDKFSCEIMEMGGDGVISVVANAWPAETAAMTKAALSGDVKKAEQIDKHMKPIYAPLFAEGNPSGVKAALSLKGRCKNNLRLPLVPVSDKLMREIKTVITDDGL
ncbi:MAG: 4-hydroxy-tetrahydrodipicolinate synthase [Bacteroidaceae bacterium]|nr:4-hydroxy-tetrahydrodipicolinate synthase [Bacteroidaceae bacterium]